MRESILAQSLKMSVLIMQVPYILNMVMLEDQLLSISLSVKAVHLELVSDMTGESFIACLCRFVARRGHLN